MDATIGRDVEVRRVVNAALRGDLTQMQAPRLHQLGPEAVAFAMLAAVKQIAEQNRKLARQSTQISEQAILMSVYRTLKLRGHHPTDVIVDALRTYVSTGKLPPLPNQAIAHG